MAKYVIKNIQCGLSGCGLCADTVIVEVEFQDESGKSVYVSAVEFECFPSIFKTDESVYNRLMNDGCESEEEADKLSSEERSELNATFFEEMNDKHGLYNGEGYEEFYDDEDCGGDLHEAMRFVIYVLRSPWEEIDQARETLVGMALGDFEIPKCDAERAWEQGVPLGEEEYDEE